MSARARRGRGLTVLLLLVCLALALLLAAVMDYSVQWRAAQLAALRTLAVQAPPPETLADLPVLADPAPLDAYAELIERPLFAENRRPYQPPPPVTEPEPPAPPAAPPSPLRAALTSIVITPDQRIALARDLGNGSTVRLERGSTLNGWTVERILPDKVIFVQGGEEEVLELRSYDKKAPPRNPLRKSR